jgi:hypothetical protein
MVKFATYLLYFVFGFNCLSQRVIDTQISGCDTKSDSEYIRNRLIAKELKQDTLTLNLGLVLNCCVTPNPSVTFINDTLFLQIRNDSDIWCACNCCFELTITIKGIPDTMFTLIQRVETREFVNNAVEKRSLNQELKQHRNKYIFPDPDEIGTFNGVNQRNSDGEKIGRWNEKKNNDVKHTIYYAINQYEKSVPLWWMMQDNSGDLIEICAKKGSSSICIDANEYKALFKH